jgi:hypothetical protein
VVDSSYVASGRSPHEDLGEIFTGPVPWGADLGGTYSPAKSNPEEVEVSQPSAPVNQPSTPSGQTSQQGGGLLSLRAVVILLVAVVVGCIAGGLAFLAGQPPAAAILLGGGAAGATLGLAHTLIQER